MKLHGHGFDSLEELHQVGVRRRVEYLLPVRLLREELEERLADPLAGQVGVGGGDGPDLHGGISRKVLFFFKKKKSCVFCQKSARVCGSSESLYFLLDFCCTLCGNT